MDIEVVLTRARDLATLAAADEVDESQLGQILAHLKAHRDVAATKELLAELPRSPFARRSNAMRRKMPALERHVSQAFLGVTAWEDAAGIVGWARRLLAAEQMRAGASFNPKAGEVRGRPGQHNRWRERR